MDGLTTIAAARNVRPKKSRFLHSPAHLLADELSRQLRDQKHFGFYLKMATTYNHDFLRRLAGEVLENRNTRSPGRLFAYLIKQHNTKEQGSNFLPKKT